MEQSLPFCTLRTSIVITYLTAKIIISANRVSTSTTIPCRFSHSQVFHRMSLIAVESIPISAHSCSGGGGLYASHEYNMDDEHESHVEV